LRLDYQNRRVFVINNGAEDALVQALGPLLDSVTVIQNRRNLGFCGGNNVVFRHALEDGADYTWLVNDDAVVKPDCLTKLVAEAQADGRLGLLSPVILHDTTTEAAWNAGGFFDTKSCSWGWFSDPQQAVIVQQERPNCFMLAGTALLVRTSLVREIGMLDERLFAYHEDTDYSIRAQVAGFNRRIVPDAAVYHKHHPDARPSRFACYYISRNETLLWRKHSGKLSRLRNRYWSFLSMRSALGKYADERRLQEACVLGWWHGQLGIGGEWADPNRAPWWLKLILWPRLVGPR